MRVGLDVDGCLNHEFANEVTRFAVEHEGLDPSVFRYHPDMGWDWWQEWGWTFEDFDHYVGKAVDAGVVFAADAPVAPGVKEGIDLMREWGHTIHICTARQFGNKWAHNTLDWFTHHDIKFDSLSFSSDKTIISVDIMLEDYAKNYQRLMAAGTRTVLMDQPWNRDLPFNGVERVTSFPEFVQIVGAS